MKAQSQNATAATYHVQHRNVASASVQTAEVYTILFATSDSSSLSATSDPSALSATPDPSNLSATSDPSKSIDVG